jgi:hypothetical protein
MDIDLGRTNVVIVERVEDLRLCVTVNPDDDRHDIVQRFKPEGSDWGYIRHEDYDNYMYLYYSRVTHPNRY